MDNRPNANMLFRQLFGVIDERIARTVARLGFTGNYLSASHVVGSPGGLFTHGATGHVAGNPGDILYAGASGQWNRLAGNTSSERKFLRQLGGTSSVLATGIQWDTLTTADTPSTAHNHTTAASDGGTLTNSVLDGYADFRHIAAPTTTTGILLYGKTGTSGLFYKTPAGDEIGPLSSATPAGAAGPHTHDNSGTASGGPLLNDLHTGYSQYRHISTPTTTTGINLYAKSGTSGLFYQTPAGDEIGPLSSGGGAAAATGAVKNASYGAVSATAERLWALTDGVAQAIDNATALAWKGPIFPLNGVTTTGTYDNLSSGTVNTTNFGLDFVQPTHASTEFTGYFWSATALGATWTAEFGFLCNVLQNQKVGIGVRQQSSSAWTIFTRRHDAPLYYIQNWTLSNSFSGDVANPITLGNRDDMMWMRVHQSAAAGRQWALSADGIRWNTISSQNGTAFFSGAPNQYGLVLGNWNSTFQIHARLVHLKVTTG